MPPDASTWTRTRLLTILAGAVVVGLLLLVGLGLFVWQVLQDDADATEDSRVDAAQPALPASGEDRRELIATGPMLVVDDPTAYREGKITAVAPETIQIPAASSTGPLGVTTGYPQTQEGAVAQLAAIDTVVLQAMSVPGTHEVYRQWGTGTGAPEQWVMTANVTDFLTAARQSGQEKETGLAVTVTPAAGQIKGADGGDWVLACVLLGIRAVLVQEAQVAYGHCEAMTWQQDRWLIDTTAQVATAPSTWPGTDLAARAGWRTWTTDD